MMAPAKTAKIIAAYILASTLCAPAVAAPDIVSLYIPGLGTEDDLPGSLTAENLGTDAEGHTTWSVALDQVTVADFTAPPLTVVEGSTDVHIFQSIPTGFPGIPDGNAVVIDDCAISDGTALCTMIQSMSGVASTFLTTESVAFLPVQVATAAAASTTGGGGSASQTGGSSSQSAKSSETTSTPSTMTNTTTTGTGSGAGNGAGKSSGAIISVGVLGAMGFLWSVLF